MSRTLLRQWVASCPALWASMHIPPVNPVRTTYLLSYHFYTQLALDILPIYTIIDMIENAG